MSHRDHGSSLLNALSVVAIAVLFPVFVAARRHSGDQIQCLSNEKQLGLAFVQYAQDNNGRLPDGVGHPYVESPVVYHCPLDATAGTAASPVVSYG